MDFYDIRIQNFQYYFSIVDENKEEMIAKEIVIYFSRIKVIFAKSLPEKFDFEVVNLPFAQLDRSIINGRT